MALAVANAEVMVWVDPGRLIGRPICQRALVACEKHLTENDNLLASLTVSRQQQDISKLLDLKSDPD